MVYRDELSQFTRIDDFLDPDEIGVIAHDVADPDDHAPPAGRFGNLPAFVEPLGDGLLEQYVVARLDGQHAGLEVRVLGSRDQHGIGRPGLPEEETVVVEALRRRESEFCSHSLPTQRVELHDACKLQPFGVSDGVFEVFVRAVARSDGDDPDGTIAWVGSVHLFSVRFNSRDAGR